MKAIWIVLAVAVIVGVGALWWNNVKPTPIAQTQSEQSSTQQSPSSSTDTSNTANGQLTAAQVAAHNTSSDCWMAISGKVYDVTSYIPAHPGGSIIATGCGKDATKLYNSRPGSNTPHPPKANSVLQQLYIGTLAK